MATKEQVTKVWIEEGCIVCDACETTAPDVFEVLEETCIIRPAAMSPDFTKPRTQEIIDAAEECPVDVIKFDTVSEEVAEEEAAPTPAAADEKPAAEPEVSEKPEPVAAAAEKPKADDAETPKPERAEKPKPETAEKPKPQKKEPAPAVKDKGDAATKKPEPTKAPAKGEPEPAIAALLKAATGRGGAATIQRRPELVKGSAANARAKDPRDLPPDARQAKVLEAARKVRQAPDQSRRDFMNNAAVTVGWVAFGVGTGISVGPAFGRFMMPNVLEEPDPRIRVGKLQPYLEMQPGEVNEDYKPQGIWMIREEERIAALSIICTHLGCIPNWLPNDRKFKCPCHGSGYYFNGINFEGPTPRPLERFRVYVEDGIVTVDKSKKYQYELGQWDQPGSFIPA